MKVPQSHTVVTVYYDSATSFWEWRDTGTQRAPCCRGTDEAEAHTAETDIPPMRGYQGHREQTGNPNATSRRLAVHIPKELPADKAAFGRSSRHIVIESWSVSKAHAFCFFFLLRHLHSPKELLPLLCSGVYSRHQKYSHCAGWRILTNKLLLMVNRARCKTHLC